MRKLIKNTKKLLLTIILLDSCLYLYTTQIEPRWVQYNDVEMLIENLPSNLEGKILVQISDIHIGDRVETGYITRVFDKINKMNPDFVVYTGDFISPVDTNQTPYEQLENVLKRHAKGSLGTLAIFGNHDYGILAKKTATADSLEKILTKHHIEVLRNTSIDKSGLNIIGIDDYWGTNFHAKEALAQYDSTRATLVLCHNPDVCDLDIWNGYKGWILSGHTHGGQIRLPFCKAPLLPVDNKEYDQGLKHLSDGRTLYINKGLGHAIKARFNVRPEVTVFTLRKGK